MNVETADSVILHHPTGNANSRAVLDGFCEVAILSAFYTSVATYPQNPWSIFSKTALGREFDRRRFPERARGKTVQRPFRELGRMVSSKAGLEWLTRHETGPFSIDAVYRGLDRYVARRLDSDRCRAVYAYEDGALESFRSAKKQGIKCFYDLPIGYWQASRRLLAEESERRPDWAVTMPGLKDSEAKLARKDEELKLADAIFVASSYTRSTLTEYPEEGLSPVHVIPYGFPEPGPTREVLADGRKLRVLFVGGLSQRKGLADVFEVADALGDEVELTVIGRGNVKACQPLQKGLSRHRWIESLPHDQVLEQMRGHDLLLFPSLFEGFGLVITEAMSQGTPVITTDRTAGGDLIIHGQNGWLVPPADADALKVQIEEILNNRACLAKVSEACRATAANRPWSVYGRQVAGKVAELIGAA